MEQDRQLNHVFLIIDGNRRYAEKAKISFEDSYRLGAEKVTHTVKWIMVDNNVANLTIFGLALSNLAGRTAEGIKPVLDAQEKAFRSWLNDDFFRNIRVRFVGKINDEKALKDATGFSFPQSYVDACRKLEQKTAGNSAKTLNVLLAYSGKEDALDAQRRFAAHVLKKGKNSLHNNGPSMDFYEHSGPDIDLIIRTSESRPLSDGPAHLTFFSEFVLINKFWPEIEKTDIDGAINIFHSKDRRFGR